MARVTEPYDVFSLLNALEEQRFIDSETIIRILPLYYDDIYEYTLEEIDFFRINCIQLPFISGYVVCFTFELKSNTLNITTN